MMRRFVVSVLPVIATAVPVSGQLPAADVTEVVSIGAVDGPLESTFSRVVAIEVASTGEILIADGAASSIRVFSPTGDFVRAFGRDGGGPAEFRALAATGMLGDTLYVLDRRLQKVAVFSLDGALIRTRRINYSPGQHGLIYRLYPLRSGGFVLESASGCYLPRRPGFDSQWWLLLLTADGEELRPIIREDLGKSVPIYGTEDDRFCTSFDVPFATGPVAAVRPDGVVVYGTGETERLAFFQLALEDDDSIGLHHPIAHLKLYGGRRSLGRDERREWLDRHVAAISGDPLRSRRASRVREVLEDLRLPEHWPAYDRLRFEADGGVWVRRPPELDAEQAFWDVYSSEGRHRGRAALPASLEVHHIRDDAVYGVIRDEWGVQHVRKYRVRWKP